MKRTAKDILAEVKALAAEYHELTGKPLGVTAEIREFEAAEKMGLEFRAARSAGYDALRSRGPWRKPDTVRDRDRSSDRAAQRQRTTGPEMENGRAPKNVDRGLGL